MSGSDLKLLAPIIGRLRLDEVHPVAIAPYGSSGYALDENGNVVGLKFSTGSDPANIDLILDVISKLRNLEKLVIAYHDPKGHGLNIPNAIGLLPRLRFLWLGGNIRSVPAVLFKKGLPLHADRPNGTRSFGQLNQLMSSLRRRPSSKQAERSDPTYDDESLAAVAERLEREPSLLRMANSLHGIYFAAETQDPPFEIIKRGQKAVEAYLAERSEIELPLNEVKVILVGDGGSGKTSLVKRLLGDKFKDNEPQTHGINIRKWQSKLPDGSPVKIHLWDFGGQEVMHATHQFFLSKRSIYIVLLDGRKEEDAEYWLQHVNSFGGDSPVMIVINKADQNPGYDINRRFLMEKYPAITGFYKISCKTRLGIQQFKSQLEEAVRFTPILSTRWPSNWFRVKERLEAAALDTSYISLSSYTDICDQEGIRDKSGKKVLVDFLHDLGVIVHFSDLHLLDTHVLNPRWVTEGVYRIINASKVAENRGLLELSELDEILGTPSESGFSYPVEKHVFLVELMLKFELCYRIGKRSILIPDLLDVQEPEFNMPERGEVINFIFEYEYLPKSVMPRFIVKMNKQIKRAMLWRTGVVLENESSSSVAMVKADPNAKRIYITVSGGDRRSYFGAIRHVFHEIHSSFERLSVKELVPLADNPTITLDYLELLGYELDGRDEVFVGRLRRAYNVRVLLNGLTDSRYRAKEMKELSSFESLYVEPSLPSIANAEDMDVSGAGLERWERAIILLSAVAFFALIAYLLIRNEPLSDPNLVVALRIGLSFVVALFGAAIPGMLKVDYSAKGLAIRATGALALFVLTFILTPTVLP